MKRKKLEFKDYSVSYKDDPETKDKVFNALLAWYKEQEVFHGESLMQCDEPVIAAPEILCDLIDVIDFKINKKNQ